MVGSGTTSTPPPCAARWRAANRRTSGHRLLLRPGDMARRDRRRDVLRQQHAQVVDRGVLDLSRAPGVPGRSEEHTSELQSRENLVCRLLLEKKKHRRKLSQAD